MTSPGLDVEALLLAVQTSGTRRTAAVTFEMAFAANDASERHRRLAVLFTLLCGHDGRGFFRHGCRNDSMGNEMSDQARNAVWTTIWSGRRKANLGQIKALAQATGGQWTLLVKE